MKASGWEVHDQNTERQLLSFLRAVSFDRWPILQDDKHCRGFLHRLDVPSSGLILAAKRLEAFYDLRLQLNVGEMVRSQTPCASRPTRTSALPP